MYFYILSFIHVWYASHKKCGEQILIFISVERYQSHRLCKFNFDCFQLTIIDQSIFESVRMSSNIYI